MDYFSIRQKFVNSTNCVYRIVPGLGTFLLHYPQGHVVYIVLSVWISITLQTHRLHRCKMWRHTVVAPWIISLIRIIISSKFVNDSSVIYGLSNQESYFLYLSTIVASEFLDNSGNCGSITSAIVLASLSFTNSNPLFIALVNLINNSLFSFKNSYKF